MHKRFLSSSFLIVVVSAVVAQAALAGGEPKNQWPFTRQIPGRTLQSTPSDRQTVASDRLGEAKNELPFTRQVAAVPADESDVVSRYLARHGLADVRAEAKNELPFTRQVAAVPIDESDVVSRYLARHGLADVRAEAKNELPFARRVGESAASSSHGGLDWTLAIGIFAAVVAVGAGLVAGARLRRIPQHGVPKTA